MSFKGVIFDARDAAAQSSATGNTAASNRTGPAEPARAADYSPCRSAANAARRGHPGARPTHGERLMASRPPRPGSPPPDEEPGKLPPLPGEPEPPPPP